MKSVIYYFTGTGNSLEVAKKIAEALPDCKLVSMGKGRHDSSEVYDTIGFIYPTYAFNLPRRVAEFLSESSFDKSKSAYYFAVTASGGRAVCSLSVFAKALKKRGVTLHFAEEFATAANAVTMYAMPERNAESQRVATENIPALVRKIISKTQQPAAKLNEPLNVSTAIFLKLFLAGKKKGYHASDACTGCGTCAAVCPVANIQMENNKPSFQRNCEQCMACIQWCPMQALNYKNKTQDRGRYQNPNITVQELKVGNESGK